MTKKKNKELEGAEYGVDSRYTSKKDREADGKSLMEARLKRMKNLSEDQITRAKLMQLKLILYLSTTFIILLRIIEL